MVRIVFAAGGSIGHIAPCIAVWEALREIESDVQALFLCSDRPEDAHFLQKEGVEFSRMGSRHATPLNVLPGILRARSLLRTWRPDAIFSKGGGMTIPVALAAWTLRIPLIVHESDAVPGRATRVLSRFAQRVIYGFPNNPVRKNVTKGSREEGLRITGLSGTRPILLVLGGSQGASAINDAVVHHLDDMLQVTDVIHITGVGKTTGISRPGYWETEFVHEELPHLYAVTDFALSRAGAGSISELAANGIPGILVPLEGLAHDHQIKNAEASSGKGFEILRQGDLARELPMRVKKFALDRLPEAEETPRLENTAAASPAQILLALVKEHGRVS